MPASESLIFENCENLWGQKVTITAATGIAEGVMTQGQALVGIFMSAAWTAAFIGYDVSWNGKDWSTAKNTVFEQTTVEAGIFVPIPVSDALFAPFIRIKSVDATNVAVAQGADRSLVLVFRRYLGGS